MFFGGYGYGFHPADILLLIGMGITLLASARLNMTFSKYKTIPSVSGISGARAARMILDANGLYDVSVGRVGGSLTDHYHPGQRAVNLSEDIYASGSIAAISVAAHECGHAIQHQLEYTPLKLRAAFLPIANIGGKIAIPLILIGAYISGFGSVLVQIGIIMFSLAFVFQIITLPVEFNASRRAIEQMKKLQLLGAGEESRARSVLSAAALTYVAGAASTLLQLLRLVAIFGGGRRRSD